jgi:hypothetical protein
MASSLWLLTPTHKAIFVRSPEALVAAVNNQRQRSLRRALTGSTEGCGDEHPPD